MAVQGGAAAAVVHGQAAGYRHLLPLCKRGGLQYAGAAGGQLGRCERTAAGSDLWQMGEHYDSALMHSRSCGIHKVTG